MSKLEVLYNLKDNWNKVKRQVEIDTVHAFFFFQFYGDTVNIQHNDEIYIHHEVIITNLVNICHVI